MDKTNNYEVGAFSFAQINLPNFKETKFNEHIKFGDGDNFPQFLIDLANKSSLHNAILGSKVTQIIGGGFEIEKENDKKTQAFLKNANKYETFEEVFTKIVYDYIYFGGYYVNLIFSRDRKSIEIYHVPFNKIRCGKKNEENQIDTYYFSNDWTQYRRAEYSPKPIPAYNSESKEASQLLAFYDYKPGQDYYSLPTYVGALSDISCDCEISNFNLSSIKNGMAPSAMITFTNGIPKTKEEVNTIERKIKDKFTSSDNAGRFILNFAEDEKKVPIVTSFSPADLAKQYIQLRSTVMQNILSGHKVTSKLLMGLESESGFGNGQELLNAFRIYESTVLSPIRKILQKMVDKITDLNGIQQIKINSMAPIEFSWSEDVLIQIMTVNELREKVGLEPIDLTEEPVNNQQPKAAGFKLNINNKEDEK